MVRFFAHAWNFGVLITSVTLVLLALPSGAMASEPDWSKAQWSWACSFDDASGELTMRSTSPGGVVLGYFSHVPLYGVVDSCVGAGGVPITSVRSLHVVSSGDVLFEVSPLEFRYRLGYQIPISIDAPSSANVRVIMLYDTGYQHGTPATALTATATGLDTTADGINDVTINTPHWNVQVNGREVTNTYDLRLVPALPTDNVEHRFGIEPVTFYGPLSGPNTTVRFMAPLRPRITKNTGGNDRITTFAGNDTILSGLGNDTIHTGAGDDIVFAGGGNDHITTETGNDWVSAYGDSTFGNGGPGKHDKVWLGPGNDYNAGSEYAWGGPGRDIMHGGSAQRIDAGADSDFVDVGSGPRLRVTCGPGNDFTTISSTSAKKWSQLAPRRTRCERNWNHPRTDPINHSYWPGEAGGRLQWCPKRNSHVPVCTDPQRPTQGDSCIQPTKC